VLFNAEDLDVDDKLNLIRKQNKKNVQKFLKHRDKCNFSSDNSSVHWSSVSDSSDSNEESNIVTPRTQNTKVFIGDEN
jgi:hypothetical protein